MSGNQVRASHILIKHQGSRRKASWKDPEGRVIMNTTRESAVSQLKSIREDIVTGKAKFEDVATRVSDCSSAKRGGDLGENLAVSIDPLFSKKLHFPFVLLNTVVERASSSRHGHFRTICRSRQ